MSMPSCIRFRVSATGFTVNVTGKVNARGAPIEVKVYPSAHHSFDLPMGTYRYKGHTAAGNPVAAADSRARMVAWFREHGNF